MAYPSESQNSLPSKEPTPRDKAFTIGMVLFDKAFDFYTWYLSYDLGPSKHPTVLEALAIFMQLAKLSFEGQNILTQEEEKHLVKELHELYESVANGLVHNKDLILSLEKNLRVFMDKNIRARLVAALMRLEYKHASKEDTREDSHLVLQQLIRESLGKISSSLPDLVVFTLCRELETLGKKNLDIESVLQEFKKSLEWLKHS